MFSSSGRGVLCCASRQTFRSLVKSGSDWDQTKQDLHSWQYVEERGVKAASHSSLLWRFSAGYAALSAYARTNLQPSSRCWNHDGEDANSERYCTFITQDCICVKVILYYNKLLDFIMTQKFDIILKLQIKCLPASHASGNPFPPGKLFSVYKYSYLHSL